MPTKRRVRPYRSERDREAVLRLIRRELAPLSRKPVGRDMLTDGALTARIRRGRTFVAARRGCAPEGFVHLMVRDTPDPFAGAARRMLQIDMLAVRRESQGLRLGAALLEEAEAYGRGRGCAEAALFVDEGNDRAFRFYARAGYRVVRHWPDYRCYELRKPLPPAGSARLRRPNASSAMQAAWPYAFGVSHR